MSDASPGPLLAVEEEVRAVVDRDDDRLTLLAPDTDDLYIWTRDNGTLGDVELAARSLRTNSRSETGAAMNAGAGS